tara:strand:- start:39245 stop:39454 length:210 start_codon:yes stop_codon:yes gene_type:complete
MRKIVLQIFLIVFYNQSEIEFDPICYDYTDEDEISFEWSCPEGHNDCLDWEAEKVTFDDVVETINNLIQ